MTSRLDDEMEAREWAKKRLYSEESHPEKWEMIDVEHAYLAGLLAERARGMGTGEIRVFQERYGTLKYMRVSAWVCPKCENEQNISDCTIHGMVPASEVERLKDYYLREILKIDQVTYDRIAEAVKRERERCAAIALKYKEVMGPDIAREILTPSGEVKTI